MKRLIMCLTGAPLLAALAACGQPDSANQAAEADNGQALPEEVILNDTAGVVEGNATAPAPAAPTVRATPPPKKPKADPKPKVIIDPPPDPHAGHDMSNMANVQ